jgi:hypothetical protein
MSPFQKFIDAIKMFTYELANEYCSFGRAQEQQILTYLSIT